MFTRFIKLPFGEQLLGPPEFIEDHRQHKEDNSGSIGSEGDKVMQQSVSKQRQLTPLADASNPIMAQVLPEARFVGNGNGGMEYSARATGVLARGLRHVKINSDSEALVDIILQKARCPWKLWGLITDIRSLMSSITTSTLDYCPRRTNHAADYLVTFDLSNSDYYFWKGVPLPGLVRLLYSVLNGPP